MHYESEAKRHVSINELLGAVLLVPRKRERERPCAHNLMSGLLTKRQMLFMKGRWQK